MHENVYQHKDKPTIIYKEEICKILLKERQRKQIRLISDESLLFNKVSA